MSCFGNRMRIATQPVTSRPNRSPSPVLSEHERAFVSPEAPSLGNHIRQAFHQENTASDSVSNFLQDINLLLVVLGFLPLITVQHFEIDSNVFLIFLG